MTPVVCWLLDFCVELVRAVYEYYHRLDLLLAEGSDTHRTRTTCGHDCCVDLHPFLPDLSRTEGPTCLAIMIFPPVMERLVEALDFVQVYLQQAERRILSSVAKDSSAQKIEMQTMVKAVSALVFEHQQKRLPIRVSGLQDYLKECARLQTYIPLGE